MTASTAVQVPTVTTAWARAFTARVGTSLWGWPMLPSRKANMGQVWPY